MNPPELPPAIRVPDLYALAKDLRGSRSEVNVVQCCTCGTSIDVTDVLPLLDNVDMADFIQDLAEFYDKRRG